MRNHLFMAAALAAISFVSCKEQPVSINKNERGSDTTYLLPSPEDPQPKKYLVEELSGVKCVNCPEGSEMLHALNAEGPYAGKLVIASLHAGTLTSPISGKEINSVQDFRTEIGETILTNIFGGDPGKPCASFDRLPIGAGTAPNNMMGYKSNWETMLGQAVATAPSAPINITITSEYNSETAEYDIAVKVSYTQALDGRHALCLYVLENGITDAQQYPEAPEYRQTEFEHLFRTSLTSYNGLEILSDKNTKEAGRVLIQNFTLKIDPSDAKQAFWKPENMELVAFVYKLGVPTDKRVYQAATVSLE